MLLMGTSAARKRQGKHAFEATDPANLRVYCTWDAWDGRIVPGHPEVADLQEEIRKAIAEPITYRVRRRANREWRSYYGHGPSPPLARGEAIEVVALPQGQVVAVRLTELPADGGDA
ncbi:MAG: hypothetical protein JOY80_05290 [Candidatus Dormibacteraeota bacterium]|nr:hypothetical protein [Candidatus Dormibacteraeota bacterium]